MVNRITWLLYVSLILNGFFAQSTNSTAYELGVETTFQEVGEATSCGLINMIVNIFQFVIIMIVTPILQARSEENVFITMAILFGICLAALLVSMLAPYEYKRFHHQQSTASIVTASDVSKSNL